MVLIKQKKRIENILKKYFLKKLYFMSLITKNRK